jgi:hypothetical protein
MPRFFPIHRECRIAGCFADLVGAYLVAPAIIGLRDVNRGVIRHRGGVSQRAAVFQVRGRARCAERVIANLGAGLCPHLVSIKVQACGLQLLH